MSDPDRMVAYTHTKMRDRPKLIHTMFDYTIPGVNMAGLASGFVVFLLVLVVGLVVNALVGSTVVMWSAVIVGGACGIATYAAWGRLRIDRMTPAVYLVVLVDWWRQPREIHGLDRDSEPDELRGRAIVWQPTTDRWWGAYAESRRVLARDRTG